MCPTELEPDKTSAVPRNKSPYMVLEQHPISLHTQQPREGTTHSLLCHSEAQKMEHTRGLVRVAAPPEWAQSGHRVGHRGETSAARDHREEWHREMKER